MVTDNLLDGSYYDSDKYESLSEKANEIRSFFVPCVISAFLEVLSEITYDDEKDELSVSSKNFSFKYDKKGNAFDLKGKFKPTEKEKLLDYGKYFAEIVEEQNRMLEKQNKNKQGGRKR